MDAKDYTYLRGRARLRFPLMSLFSVIRRVSPLQVLDTPKLASYQNRCTSGNLPLRNLVLRHPS